MAFFTYILRSTSSGRFYIGHTENVTTRLAEHNANRVTSTRNRGPWELLHTEEFPTRTEAMLRERELKRMKSHRWIELVVRASRSDREGR